MAAGVAGDVFDQRRRVARRAHRRLAVPDGVGATGCRCHRRARGPGHRGRAGGVGFCRRGVSCGVASRGDAVCGLCDGDDHRLRHAWRDARSRGPGRGVSMKSLRLTGGLLLCAFLLAAFGTAAAAQTSSRRQGDPRAPVSDPTALTTQERQAAEERARWEREVDRDYWSRRYYWRPVLRVGQDYALRAGETVRSVTVAFGSARIEGRVEGDLVVICGPLTLGRAPVVEGSFAVIGGTATVEPGAMVRDEVMAVGSELELPDGFLFGGQHIVIGTRALGRWMESVVPWVTYGLLWGRPIVDRKSTRLNSSHSQISYAVFCLKKKTRTSRSTTHTPTYT